jgi:hypothetical protein
VLVVACAICMTGVGPVAAGPQDDDTGAAPPVAVQADGNIYKKGSTGSAWVRIDGAGSSGGTLESGQEQQVIKAAAAAAGVQDASSAGGDSDGSANEGSGGTSSMAPVFTECSWRAADLPVNAPEWQGNDPATGQLMVDPCNGQQVYVFVPNEALGIAAAVAPLPPPDPAVLAQQAYAELVPPSPTAHRSPAEDMPGGAWTVVNLWTWFWVDRAGWVPLTRTVELRGVTATVTATPTVTTFDPGNGDALVSCDGPGKAWVYPGGNSDPQPTTVGGCGYQYRRVSDGVQATTSITYAVTWTSNTGAGGNLPDLAGSTTSAPFRVEQIQVVVGGS